MKTLLDELKQAKEKWDIKKDYNKEPIKEVYDYLVYLHQNDISKARYNSAVKDYIVEKEKLELDAQTERYLLTEIFLAQHKYDREKTENYKQKMLASGWLPLTKEIIDKAIAEKKKLYVNATANNDWATIKIDKIYKPKIFNGVYGLMDLKARTRGYSLSQFENAFCKLV